MFFFLNGIYFLGYGWVGTPQNKFHDMFSPRMHCCGPGTPGINFQDSFEDRIYQLGLSGVGCCLGGPSGLN